MAVPKRKMSRSNTRNRRSQWKAKLTELNTIRVQGREISVPPPSGAGLQGGPHRAVRLPVEGDSPSSTRV